MNKLTLRDINFAKTRFNILEAFLKLVKNQKYEDITIDDICNETLISRGTFFNYFPSKEHIYTYFGWCFCADLLVELNEKRIINLSCYDKIKFIFNYTVKLDYLNSHQFASYISHILRRNVNIIDEIQYYRSDFLYRYPNNEELISESKVLYIPTVSEVFYNLLTEGISKDEFKNDTNIEKVFWNLLSIYFSPPIIHKFTRKECSLKEIYSTLLDDIMKPILNTKE